MIERLRWAWAIPVIALVASCDALAVTNPTTILQEELENPHGADLLRVDALRHLYRATGQGALTSGLLSDEFFSDPDPFLALLGRVSEDEVLDRRQSARYEEFMVVNGGVYGSWANVRIAATEALTFIRPYAPEAVRSAYIAQMQAARGYAALRMAEDFCPGFALSTQVDHKPVFGDPLTTDEAFEHALADLDSATVAAGDSARILNLASVGKGRALLGLGRFSEALAVVAAVPTTFVWLAEFHSSDLGNVNPLHFGLFGNVRRSVSDREGKNGLAFVSSDDPRLSLEVLAVASDGSTPLVRPFKYSTQGSPIVLASGIEARLIEAEAYLQGGDVRWLSVLNELRSTQAPAPMEPLLDPGSDEARVDLIFHERAFWLFGTGHRLADLRRLVRIYGRQSDAVFPTGDYWLGGGYDDATSIPFPASQEAAHNPAVSGCTSR